MLKGMQIGVCGKNLRKIMHTETTEKCTEIRYEDCSSLLHYKVVRNKWKWRCE